MIHPWRHFKNKSKCKGFNQISHPVPTSACLDPKHPWIIHHCSAAERLPRQRPSPSLSSYFAPSDYRVLIRKHWLLNPLFSSTVLVELREPEPQRNQWHQSDQYQDWPALPVWIRYSRKFANSPNTQLNISRYRAPVKDPVVSVGLLFQCTHSHKLSLFCTVGKTRQS